MDAEDVKLHRHAARLATMAGLARPVQHELNNLLTVIFANLEMLKRTATEGVPQRQLDRIHEAAKRFEASTRAALSLARRPVPEWTDIALPTAVAALQPLLAMLLPAPGALHLSLGPPGPVSENPAGIPQSVPRGWAVRLDRAALDEALLSLASEATERLPRGAGLAIEVADRPGLDGVADAVELRIGRPDGLALHALEGLRALALAAGGTSEETVGGKVMTLCLRFPRSMPGETHPTG